MGIGSRQARASNASLLANLFLGMLLAVVHTGCLPSSENSEFIDLIGGRTPFELQWEEREVDMGNTSARRHLAAGWNPPSADGAQSFIWSRGDQSVFEFDLIAPRNVTLVLRCRSLPTEGLPPQEVVVLIGDAEVGRVFPGRDFADHSVPLPKDRLKVGRNSVVFRYRWARSPKSLGDSSDWRRLAIAVEKVEIRGAHDSAKPSIDSPEGALTLPAGSSVKWALTIHRGATLQAQQINGGIGGGMIVVSAMHDDGNEQEIARWAAGSSLRASFPDTVNGPSQLVLRHQPGLSDDGPIVIEGLGLRRLVLNPSAVEDRVRDSGAQSLGQEKADRFNVVIYLVDALRADHLGVYGYSRPTSPRIDAFAKDSLVFDQAWANSSWTRPAVASILTGLRPEVHATNRRDDRLPNEIDLLPELLLANGYHTAAIVANPNISSVFGFDRGFEEFTLLPTEESRSADIHEEASRWILDVKDSPDPFFLYLHTVDPHLPYDPPEAERAQFVSGDQPTNLGSTETVGTLQARHLVDEAAYVGGLIDLYDAEIAANDRQFGRLLDHIDALDLADNTVVLFLSDHGEEFFDHGGWIHGTSLYKEVLKIPLIIRVPNGEKGSRTATLVQQADLMPTILALLGIEIPPNLQGRNLLEANLTRVALGAFLDLDGAFGRSVVDDRWHAIQHGSHGYMGQPEIYSIDSDPGEEHNRAPDLPVLPALMLGDDRALIEGHENRFNASDVEVDMETRKQLEALGYL